MGDREVCDVGNHGAIGCVRPLVPRLAASLRATIGESSSAARAHLHERRDRCESGAASDRCADSGPAPGRRWGRPDSASSRDVCCDPPGAPHRVPRSRPFQPHRGRDRHLAGPPPALHHRNSSAQSSPSRHASTGSRRRSHEHSDTRRVLRTRRGPRGAADSVGIPAGATALQETGSGMWSSRRSGTAHRSALARGPRRATSQCSFVGATFDGATGPGRAA